MTGGTSTRRVDGEKLRAILCERGLPSKMGAQLNPTERKIHELLCASYDFSTGIAHLDMPEHILRRCGEELRKLWIISEPKRMSGGKVGVGFELQPKSIHTTLKTVMAKDPGMLNAKVNQVLLHTSWTKYLRAKPKTTPAGQVDWSREERAARRQNAAITEQILDGKTFNAHKDNPWARKHLKNRDQ